MCTIVAIEMTHTSKQVGGKYASKERIVKAIQVLYCDVPSPRVGQQGVT
jgi:hypothetical protein